MRLYSFSRVNMQKFFDFPNFFEASLVCCFHWNLTGNLHEFTRFLYFWALHKHAFNPFRVNSAVFKNYESKNKCQSFCNLFVHRLVYRFFKGTNTFSKFSEAWNSSLTAILMNWCNVIKTYLRVIIDSWIVVDLFQTRLKVITSPQILLIFYANKLIVILLHVMTMLPSELS
jgi:hypothetical protein